MQYVAVQNMEGSNLNLPDKRDFIDLSDLTADEIKHIINKAKELKSAAKTQDGHPQYLKGKQLAMIFEKASTRTRVSFEIGINQLGGNAIYLNNNQSHVGRGEPIKDTAGVLSRYADLIMIRTFEHETLKKLAEFSSIPVINGLTNYSHPCQILADIIAVEEHFSEDISNKKIVWFGDVNNVSTSWIHASEKLGFELVICCPKELNDEVSNSKVTIENDPKKAAEKADVVVTDTWVSMGDEAEAKKKLKLLSSYQVNNEIMKKAKEEAIFLHCLPAHRGEEVTSEVIDGPQSVIYDEAENRLHAQKAVMLWCMKVI